mmetsp:Transcript_36130/g.62523  ORF Transcript_36130/g.62523 Transcript_36130/m.62523 type:complete len:208 (+) Transcript_36130:120-743(+)
MVGACASPTADSFVVVETRLIPERKVVHGALGARQLAQSAVQSAGDGLRDLDVAGHHGGWVLRVDHRALGQDHLERLEATRVEGDLFVHQSPEHIEHSCLRDGHWGVEVGRLLRRSAGEVERDAPVGAVDLDAHFDVRRAILIVIHLIRELRRLVGQLVYHAADSLLGVVLHVPHVSLHHVQPKLAHHLVQVLDPGLIRGDLRTQVG